MTDEKFEQMLKMALAPEISESEIMIKGRTKRYHMGKSVKMVLAAAACAVLAVGIPTAVDFRAYEKSTTAVSSDNPFVIHVMASELETDSVTYLEESSWDAGWGFGYLEDTGEVTYTFLLPFSCTGDKIETITYSVSKGAFYVLEPQDESIIIDSVAYSGTFEGGTYGGNINHTEPQAQHLYTSYTVSYDQQTDDETWISLWGKETVSKEECYDVLFASQRTDESMAELINKVLGDVEIACTVQFTDGTSDTKSIDIGASVMTYEEAGFEKENPKEEALFIQLSTGVSPASSEQSTKR